MIHRLWEWLHRGEMPDPVDDHYATAAAILRPDSLPDPGWCGCTDHTSPMPADPT